MSWAELPLVFRISPMQTYLSSAHHVRALSLKFVAPIHFAHFVRASPHFTRSRPPKQKRASRAAVVPVATCVLSRMGLGPGCSVDVSALYFASVVIAIAEKHVAAKFVFRFCVVGSDLRCQLS